MIKTEKEYRQCLQKLDEDMEVIEKSRVALRKDGLTDDEIRTALEPSNAFHEQLNDEVSWYERVKRREFGCVENLTDLGRVLIALRIANGISQRQLAGRLSVDESQVSRDERNEYHGITLERAQKIVEALGEKIVVRVEDKPFRRAARTIAK